VIAWFSNARARAMSMTSKNVQESVPEGAPERCMPSLVPLFHGRAHVLPEP